MDGKGTLFHERWNGTKQVCKSDFDSKFLVMLLLNGKIIIVRNDIKFVGFLAKIKRKQSTYVKLFFYIQKTFLCFFQMKTL